MNKHQRLTAETEAEKQVGLEHLKMNQQNRLCNETLVDKEARLENKKQRLQAETLENSLSRLERMSTRQRERLEIETPEQRSVRLSKKYVSEQNSSNRLVPLLNDVFLKEKIKIFHESMCHQSALYAWNISQAHRWQVIVLNVGDASVTRKFPSYFQLRTT